MRALPFLVVDAVLIIGFAALGRRSHEEGSGLAGILEVAAPFLIALAVGWLVSRAWRDAGSLRTGVIIWGTVVVGGLAMRSWVFDRGIAPAFIVVAAVTLGLLLVGWRALLHLGPVRRALPGG